MVQKAEIIVDSYDNGYGLQWVDLDGEESCIRQIAKNEDVENTLGRLINSDVFEMIDKMGALKVKIKLEYEILY